LGVCFARRALLSFTPVAELLSLGIMRALALKTFVGVFGAFAAYYTYFLGSVFYELYGPSARFCGTAQVWALQGAAIFFAPPALLGSVGLWFAGRQRQAIGIGFSRVSRVEIVILILCALANFIIFVPAF
jgi:hypothetical protein